MATTKTLTPTNQAITLAAFTEKPDNRTNVTNDDKLADAINALNSKLNNLLTWNLLTSGTFTDGTYATQFTVPSNAKELKIQVEETFWPTVIPSQVFVSGWGWHTLGGRIGDVSLTANANGYYVGEIVASVNGTIRPSGYNNAIKVFYR